MKLPNDPFILFSFLNTQLRDSGLTLADFGAENALDAEMLIEKMKKAGFRYDAEHRCFR